MADSTPNEVSDDVQQHDAPPVTETEADGLAQAPQAEVTGDQGTQDAQHGAEDVTDAAHPLDPDGKRFKQVWARAKTAEQAAATTREELQREREERIRLEERLKAREETVKASKEPEYSWDQLEAAIDAGKITRAWAQDYREKLVAKKSADEAEARIMQRWESTSKDTNIIAELDRYKSVMPEINQIGTLENTKMTQEYQFLVGKLGYPKTYATQLAAARAAVGDIESLEKTVQAKRTTRATQEPYMETQSTGGRPQPKAKDPVANLSPQEKEHYEKMIKSGRYGGWEDVRKELNYVPPSLAYKRR